MIKFEDKNTVRPFKTGDIVRNKRTNGICIVGQEIRPGYFAWMNLRGTLNPAYYAATHGWHFTHDTYELYDGRITLENDK